MRYRYSGLKFSVILALAAFWGLAWVSNAHAAASSLLKTILTNSRTLQQIQEDAGLKCYMDPSSVQRSCEKSIDDCDAVQEAAASRLEEKSDLCQDFGSGCLMVTYLDDRKMVTTDSAMLDARFNRQGIGDQLVLQSLAEVESYDAKKDRTNADYKGAFSKAGYFNIRDSIAHDSEKTREAVEKLKSGALTSDEFVKKAQLYPMAFGALPSAYQSAIGTPAADALREASTKALLLTLDALVAGADSSRTTYPYNDLLVSHDNLLNPSSLYRSLKQLGKWPAFRALTPEVRESLGGVYAQKASDHAWEVKGAYDSQSNVVWLDYSASFFENLYVLYHELWHVAWAHSNYTTEVDSIIGLTSLPESAEADSTLFQAVLNYLSRNELLALDQQNRLYHAMGLLTQDWAQGEITSAMNWHDSYFGKEDYQELLTRGDRQQSFGKAKTIALTALPFLAAGKMAEFHYPVALDDSYWRSQLQVHAKYFENIYLNGLVDSIQVSSLEQAINLQNMQIVDPEIPVLTCAQAKRILRVLGESWRFGIPFTYQLSDGDRQSCDLGPIVPNEPENEGTHSDVAPTAVTGAKTDLNMPLSRQTNSATKPSENISLNKAARYQPKLNLDTIHQNFHPGSGENSLPALGFPSLEGQKNVE
jgi:hypothetical protein